MIDYLASHAVVLSVVGLISTIVLGLFAFIVPSPLHRLVRSATRLDISKERSKFPFDIITVADLIDRQNL